MAYVTLDIRHYRERAGLSQMELAERVGVRQATISDLETGRARTLRLSLLGALADALGVEPGKLILRTSTVKANRKGRRDS